MNDKITQLINEIIKEGQIRWPILGGNGGRLDYWTRHTDAIKQMITVNQLKPLDLLPSIAAGKAPVLPPKKGIAPIDLGIWGGMTIPHLHFGDNVYLLNEKQWDAFSGKILEQGKAALGNAKTIGFTAAMNLAQVMQSLALPQDPIPLMQSVALPQDPDPIQPDRLKR